jgi:hypothetical protein
MIDSGRNNILGSMPNGFDYEAAVRRITEASVESQTCRPTQRHGKLIREPDTPSMSFFMAFGTKSYEIFYQVVPEVTPPLNVMDLKSFHSPAPLATPAISL